MSSTKEEHIFKFQMSQKFFHCHIFTGYSPKCTGEVRKKLGCYSWLTYLCLDIIRKKKSGFAFSSSRYERKWKNPYWPAYHKPIDLFCLRSLWMVTVSSHYSWFVWRHWAYKCLESPPCLALLQILSWSKTKHISHCCSCFQLIPAVSQFPAFPLQVLSPGPERDQRVNSWWGQPGAGGFLSLLSRDR